MSSIAQLHTFGFTSQAENIFVISSIETLRQYFCSEPSTQYIILGEGSNTIFLEDYAGIVLKMAIKGIDLKQTDDHFFLSVGAGENWHDLVQWCLAHHVYGLENLALIPGTVGAAPIQNIGAYGVELDQFVDQIEYLNIVTGELNVLGGKDCQFGYRDSIFKNELLGKAVITRIVLKLTKQWQAVTRYGELKDLVKPSAQDIFNKVVAVRQAKLPDPKKLGNAGSFFKNPIIDSESFKLLKQKWPAIPSYKVNDNNVKIPAAWLIDTLGFKGKKIGGISCHANQPLVLTNDGTGTGQELLTLARDIRNKVRQQFSITLENEVRLIGQDGPVLL